MRPHHAGPGGPRRAGFGFGFGFGPRPEMHPLFGGFPGGGPGRRPKARRGDVRTAALLVLAEEPRSGYAIIQALEERSGGLWRPSPGSIYPTLQQLEDEGLVRSVDAGGRRRYELTEEGRAEVAARPACPAPWETFTETLTDQAVECGALLRDVGLAFVQVLRAGSDAQVAQAGRVLADTRRALYRILADGDGDGGPEATA